MKIWVIGRGYPTALNRMWGSFEFEQAKLLARNGYDVSYIALTFSFFSRKDPRGLRIFEESAVKVYACSQLYFPGKSGIYLRRFEDHCWRLLFERAENGSGLPDRIHVHYPSMVCSIHEIEKYRRRGVKLYVTEHWSRVLVHDLKKNELERLKYYANYANCFASVSEVLQNAVADTTSVTVPMEVIPNVVSPLFFETGRSGHNDNDIFTFIAVGRLVPLKQFDIVIKQFIKNFDGDPKVKLRIVGAGSDLRKLKELAGKNSQIEFTGGLSLEDTVKEVAAADALISFSKYETFAAPVAEACACGKPVIVSSESGISLYINEKIGFVIAGDAYEELGSAMKKIYDNYIDYDSDFIRNFALIHFSDHAVLDKLNDMYINY